jgi:hypothetical protein
MNTQVILKEYFSLFKKMRAEYQFNKKVELNMFIQKFKESNGLVVIPKQGGLNGQSVILKNSVPVGELVPKYNKEYEIIKNYSLLVY